MCSPSAWSRSPRWRGGLKTATFGDPQSGIRGGRSGSRRVDRTSRRSPSSQAARSDASKRDGSGSRRCASGAGVFVGTEEALVAREGWVDLSLEDGALVRLPVAEGRWDAQLPVDRDILSVCQVQLDGRRAHVASSGFGIEFASRGGGNYDLRVQWTPQTRLRLEDCRTGALLPGADVWPVRREGLERGAKPPESWRRRGNPTVPVPVAGDGLPARVGARALVVGRGSRLPLAASAPFSGRGRGLHRATRKQRVRTGA